MTTGKNIALTRWTFVDKVMSLLFNMLSRVVITFLPRSKHLLISWLRSPSADAFGTWTYIIIQSVVIVCWMVINAVGIIYQWDRYPFILLNLAFSAQASYAAPLILMASNRTAQRDRMTLEHDAQETDAILKIQDTQIELLR